MEECKKLREICEELDVSRRAVQGYEKAGLVEASKRNKYGHLLYDKKDLERIRKIKLFRDFGFHINEIAEFIDESQSVIIMKVKKQLVYLNQEHERMDLIVKKAEKMIKEYEESNRKSLRKIAK